MRMKTTVVLFTSLLFLGIACTDDSTNTTEDIEQGYPAVEAKFQGKIDLNNLENYANQDIPSYITKDNTGSNGITDKGATLGRILFYDKSLSSDNSIACASCHKQDKAFGDDDNASQGVNGTTGRHSMRLINSRFSEEVHFFWDERANTLEEQSTQPIQDHIEMGFSGTNGDGDFQDLITKLESIDYYPELFSFVYGDEEITEEKMQLALAQFIRSIQSFDSKFDAGMALTNNLAPQFPNFTPQENQGKALFLRPPVFDANGVRTDGGAGCQGCHRGPEFDIAPNSGNNGVVGVLGSATEIDLTNTKSPTLRDVMNQNGDLNGFLMHNASFGSLRGVIAHYNSMSTPVENNNLDNRLRPRGNLQSLNLSQEEQNNLFAFLQTLSGSDVYSNPKWSNPFD
jgi:cytochrome c peroxidase